MIFAVLVFPLVLSLALTKKLSHDEHQHVAAGVLLARQGLLPYVDYPYFHMPFLVGFYALCFRFSDHLLLAARLFSTICATGMVAFCGTAITRYLLTKGITLGRATLAGLLGVLLMVSAGVFTYTTGRAWNMEPATLCAVGAFLLMVGSFGKKSGAWIFFAGLVLGLAVGFRITFAPLVAPFAAICWLEPSLRRQWKSRIGWLAGGLALSLAIMAWLWWQAPEEAWYGNFGFAGTNITYRFGTGSPRTMTFLTKLRYLVKNVILDDPGLVLAFLAPICVLLSKMRRGMSYPLQFLLLTLPFLMIGSLAPSPMFDQYFYPFVFFLTLGAGYAFGDLQAVPTVGRWMRVAVFCSLAGVVFSMATGFEGYRRITSLFLPGKWVPLRVHEEGVELRAQVPSGEVLTLAPIYVLEGGLMIYPTFATGPFAWRVSSFVESKKAFRLSMTSPATLEALLKANPPEGILIGLEKKGEERFKAYAIDHKYRQVPADDDEIDNEDLWIKRP